MIFVIAKRSGSQLNPGRYEQRGLEATATEVGACVVVLWSPGRRTGRAVPWFEVEVNGWALDEQTFHSGNESIQE
jgi:hypothetical protein